MEREKIIKAVKALNKSGLAKGEIRIEDIKEEKDLVDVFLVAVETVNPEEDNKLPKIVSDTYNALVDELEGKDPDKEDQSNKEKEESDVSKENGKNGKNRKDEKKVEPEAKAEPVKKEKKVKEKKESALEFGRRLFKEGKTKDEVKKALVDLYIAEKAADEKFAAARAAAIYRTVSKEK